MKIAAIDFETANANPASICAVGISVFEDGKGISNYYSLIHPEDNASYFYWGNIRVHGIHPEDVIDAPRFHEIYDEITQRLDGALVCAHNAPFDMSCLRKTCWNTRLPVPDISYFDTVRLSKKYYPELSHHRLNDMCSYLDIPLDHHNAASDAYGCLMIVLQTLQRQNIDDVESLLESKHIRTHHLLDKNN